MKNQSFERLEGILNNLTSSLNNCYDCKRYVDWTQNEFNEYSDIIQSFFVGKQNEIKEIYNAIRMNEFPYNKIRFIDINMAIHMYGDYFKGMTEFIRKVTDLKDSDEVENNSIQMTIEHVQKKDTGFIDSIIGGERNPETEVDLDTAMINIESLINIYNDFDQFKELLNTLCDNISSNGSTKYANEIASSMRAFIMSFSRYNNKCIKEILITYNNIRTSMEHRVPVDGDKKIPEYKLF